MTTENMAPIKDTTQTRMREWLMWKVLLPFAFMFLMWPIYAIFAKNHDAFAKAFAHGEFLIFAALVLIEVALELRNGPSASSSEGRADFARFGAFFLIFLFGFLRAAVIQEEHSKTPEHQRLIYFACFSCSVGVFAVCVALVTYWRSKGHAAEQHLQQIINPGGEVVRWKSS